MPRTPHTHMNNTNAANALMYMKHTEPVYKIQRLADRYVGSNGKIYFDVEWDDGSWTAEPRDSLLKQVRGMVHQYERTHTNTTRKSGGSKKRIRTRKTKRN